MGALDFLKDFEGRVLDAASYQLLKRNYELQEENNRQLKEKVERLEKDISTIQEQVDRLLTENDKLKKQLTEKILEEQFFTYKGFAFKQIRDGEYEPIGYCPNCKSVMGNAIRNMYQCPKCKYITKCQTRPDVLALQLNSKKQNGDIGGLEA